MGHLEHNQFVGSMAFNRFIQASPSPAAAAPPPSEAHAAAAATADSLDVGVVSAAERFTSPPRTITIASENNSADTVSASLVGDYEKEKDKDKDTASNDFIQDENNDFDDDHDDHDDDMYVVEDNSYIPGGGGVFEEAKEVALNVLRRESIVGNIAMAQSFVLDSEGHRRHHGVGGEMERSGTTVTATTEVTIYYCCSIVSVVLCCVVP